ncbi:MAG: hypothetical protein JWQ63_2312 [Mucilaginibacter sp.]|nr:hypothetical protein [Mucilaginibacter sp.]
MNIKCLFLLLIITLIGLSSCKNNDNVFKTVTYTDLTVVNASADTLNFYLNGTRQNNSSSLYPTGYVAHDQSIPSGLQNYQFKKAGNSAVLFSVPLNLTAKTYYSLYLTGESADRAFYHADTLYRDSLPNMATVRFVHAASDAGNLDVYVGNAVNFKNRSFKTTSVFLPIGSGPQEVKIFQTGAIIPKVDTVITIQQNLIYTLFSKGLVNGKGSSAFGVGIVLN